jgi:signal transduction histidine kinase
MDKQVTKSTQSVLKRFLAIFLPLFVLMFSIMTILTYKWDKDELRAVKQLDSHDLELQKEKIIKDFKFIVSDLIFLSEMAEFSKIIEGGGPDILEELSNELLVFCRNKKIYHQVLFLDKTGTEVIRVNYNGGNPSIVPKERLQSQRHRYYFKETIQLAKWEVYVSPFAPNIEDGKIERPLMPVIHFGTPVFDDNGQKQGILIYSCLGDKLIHNLKKTTESEHHAFEHTMLLNPEGFWLHHLYLENEWGFVLGDRRDRTLGESYPEAWKRIKGVESGQFFDSDGALFTFDTLYPSIEARRAITYLGYFPNPNFNVTKIKSNYWKLVHRIPPEFLKAKSHKTLGYIILGIIAIPFVIGSWILAFTGIKRKRAEEALRKAHNGLEIKVEERTADLAKTNKELRSLSAHLQSVREEERTSIAREMHDELGQILTALQMGLAYLTQKLPKEQKTLIKKTSSMSELIDTSIQTVKRISSNLRPSILDNLGIKPAVKRHAKEFQSHTGIKCSVTFNTKNIVLDKDRSTAIFRIFQESLTNVARHANATTVMTNFKNENGRLILIIKDNGKGIAKKQISSPDSFGIIGIRERAYLVGGKLKIDGDKSKGTTITVSIPLS